MKDRVAATYVVEVSRDSCGDRAVDARFLDGALGALDAIPASTGLSVRYRPLKPTYYIGYNTSGRGFEFARTMTIGATARTVQQAIERKEKQERHLSLGVSVDPVTCVFVLKVHGASLAFIHADRFLDSVAEGSVTDANSDQNTDSTRMPRVLGVVPLQGAATKDG